MRFVQIVVLLLFLLAVFLFALQNTQVVEVRFLGWGLRAPVPLLILGVYVLGMLTGGMVVGFLRRSLQRVSERRD